MARSNQDRFVDELGRPGSDEDSAVHGLVMTPTSQDLPCLPGPLRRSEDLVGRVVPDRSLAFGMAGNPTQGDFGANLDKDSLCFVAWLMPYIPCLSLVGGRYNDGSDHGLINPARSTLC